MIRHLNSNLLLLLVWLTLFFFLYYFIDRLTGKLLEKVRDNGLKLLLHKFLLALAGLSMLYIIDEQPLSLLSVENYQAGILWLLAGISFACLVGLLTYQMIRNGNYGKEYVKTIGQSPFLTILTLILFVGPAEDFFFLGFAQNILASRLNLFAVPFYILLFSFYHYLNVLSGMETRQEFFGMLPVRLIIAAILSLSFYYTGSLLYPLIIHNLFDTINYLGVLAGIKRRAG
ncbi:MAG: CPBP family intramembrane glutamic endopeptidase [Halanaerobium sp.]|nr:CPBP family intramembrane glutamic endopeptidase [Halanaerobium sp.]